MALSLDPQFRDALARAICEDPLWGSDSANGAPGDKPGASAWDLLPKTTQTAFRRQADEIAQMLGTIGAVVLPIEEGGHPFQVRPVELEVLAEQEHERWMRDRRAGGWCHGPRRDSADRTHPSMIPYSELPESERDKDRERVLRFPGLLVAAGLGVVRS